MKAKIYKALSVLLALIIVFSTCSCVFGTVSAAGKTKTYYVSVTGDDSKGGGKMAPNLTLGGAVTNAVASGYGAGDIVTVKVMGTDPVKWGTIPAHDFQLVVTSNTSVATIGDNTSGVTMGGDTRFENITVWIATWPTYNTLYMNGHNVTFASDVTVKSLDVGYFALGTNTGNGTYDAPINVEINTKFNYFYLCNSYHTRTFNGNINIVSNSADATPKFYFGTANSTVTYNANVNLYIKKASSVTLSSGDTAPVFGDNGALQIIDIAGKTITDSKNIIKGAAAGKAYILHNKTDIADLISFTDTKGKFAVDTDRFTITATPVGEGNPIVAQDGYLTVPAGEYNVTLQKVPETKTFYVETGADGTNDTYATIADAITAANNLGYITGDVITLKLKGESVLLGTLPLYKFDAVIISDDESIKTKISIPYDPVAKTGGSASIANNEGSKTTYVNVEINNNGGEWKSLFLASSNVVISEDVKLSLGYGTQLVYGTSNDGGTAKTVDGQTVELSGTIPHGISVSSGVWSRRTYTKDANLIINNGAGSPIVYLNASYTGSTEGRTTIYKKNLNINIKNAANTSFEYGTGATVEGAFQIINSTSAVLGLDTKGIVDVVAGKKFIINNTSGNATIVEFTDDAGIFKLVPPKATHSVVIKDSDGNVVPANNDLVTLTESGVYTAEIVKPKETPTFYAQTGSQYETVAAAVEAAVASGYTKGDIVTVRIKGESVDFGALPAYKFDLIVMSDNTALRSIILINGSATIANNQGSKTTYDNVEFDNGSLQWKNIFFNSCNIVLTDTVKFTVGYGTSFYFGVSRDGKTVAGQNVEIASNIHYAISVTNLSRCDDRTYTEDVNLLVNNPTAKPHIWFNASDKGESNGTAFFKKNLNINLRKASGIASFAYGKGVTIEGGLQIINSTTDNIKITNEEIAAINCDNKYILNNKSGEVDLVEFTETAGKFKVTPSNPSYLVYAKDSNGKVTYAENGFLTLSAGEYEVRIDRDPVIRDYYISSDGKEIETGTRPANAATKKNPVKSFADVTRLIAQDNMADMDIANVYIMGQKVDWDNTVLDGNNVAISSDAPIAHACTVVFDSATEGERPVIYKYNSINLQGNTTFKNVELQQGYQWSSFRLGHNNVIFDEGSYINVPTAYIGYNSSPASIDKPVNITVNGKFAGAELTLGSEYHSGTYNEDINIIYNNADTNAAIRLGGSGIDNQNYTYNGNINMTILKAKSFSFSQAPKCTVTINGALQAVVDDSVLLPYSTQTKFNALDVKGGKWYITNAASSDDFVKFTNKSGKFATKKKKTAYVRQTEVKKQQVIKGGSIELPSGAYTVSDKSLPFLPDESHKMLYFSTAGGGHHLASRAKVTPGETYIYEYSIYCNLYADCTPCVRDDGDRGVTATPVIISEEKVGDYYKIVCEATIPETYDKGSTAFFGVNLYSYSEGVIFDRTVYNKNDPEKTNCLEKNPNFHDGLDGVALDMAFWGGTFTGDRGGSGVVLWEKNFQKLEIVSFSEDFIKELIRLSNPDDGKWWNDEDIVEEEVIVTYASAHGTFKDHEGNPVEGVKMLLASADNEYTATTDAKGEFVFGEKVDDLDGKKIVSGFYELYFVNGDENIFTGFTQYIAADDDVDFNITTDLSKFADIPQTEDAPTVMAPVQDYTEVEPGEEVEEISQTGNLYGTIYTPYLDTVSGVRVYLEGINGQVTSNENGEFGFGNLPIGKYRVYTVLSDGSEYDMTEVEIFENSDTRVKIKYDPPKVNEGNSANNGWIIWVIIASVIALVVVAGLIFFLVIKKKKA